MFFVDLVLIWLTTLSVDRISFADILGEKKNKKGLSSHLDNPSVIQDTTITNPSSFLASPDGQDRQQQ